MQTQTKTFICPFDRSFRVVADRREIFPDDPGQGTPAMVYGPRESCGTLFCVTDTGELSCGPTMEYVPDGVGRWLEQISDDVDAFLYPDD